MKVISETSCRCMW